MSDVRFRDCLFIFVILVFLVDIFNLEWFSGFISEVGGGGGGFFIRKFVV